MWLFCNDYILILGLYKDDATYGDCSKTNWNSVGEGLMFQDLGIPIFVLKEESDVDFIIEKVRIFCAVTLLEIYFYFMCELSCSLISSSVSSLLLSLSLSWKNFNVAHYSKST